MMTRPSTSAEVRYRGGGGRRSGICRLSSTGRAAEGNEMELRARVGAAAARRLRREAGPGTTGCCGTSAPGPPGGCGCSRGKRPLCRYAGARGWEDRGDLAPDGMGRPYAWSAAEDMAMRAVWITKPGGPEALEVRETADPVPGPGQLRIRVRAAGLNFADVMAAQGLYPDAPKPPCVVGYEVAGVVDALGERTQGYAAGQRVLAMTHFGGHADVVCVPADYVLAIPDAMSFEEAAAIPVNYVTAYHMLFRVAGVRPGERVLVHMAAGGVGTAVLQLCRTVEDLEVFGTASAAKHDVLKAQGCAHPIDYHATDYAAEVRRLTGGEGVDIVLDPLGGNDWRKGLKLL